MPEKVKVISQFKNNAYRTFFPDIHVAAEGSYFLQFNGYIVYLPSVLSPKKFLNVFEMTVLQLLDIEPFTQEDLAEKLCLRVDFVKNICDKLFELQLTDRHRRITSTGKIFLGAESEIFSKQNIIPYFVLVTRDTGEIFPKLFSRDNLETGILEDTKIFAEKSVPFRVPGIFVNQKARKSHAIGQNILRELAENFHATNENKIFLEPSMQIASAYSEPIFLHIKVILQNRRDKIFLVSDGDSVNDIFLNSYANRQPKDILANLQLLTFRR